MFGDGSFVSEALGNSVPLTKVNGFPEIRNKERNTNTQTHKHKNTAWNFLVSLFYFYVDEIVLLSRISV